jgi:hypothetical protein
MHVDKPQILLEHSQYQSLERSDDLDPVFLSSLCEG